MKKLRSYAAVKKRKPPKVRARITKRNAKRKGSRFPKLRDPAYLAWIRRQNCCIGVDNTFVPNWDVRPRIEAAHVISRGAGGADRGNVVPLCNLHHDEQHRLGMETFQRIRGMNLAQEALKFLAQYEREMKASVRGGTAK